ncbi:MAG: cytochrome c [Deltaproteobacteria bacterium]|jgi:mono/diheme cytochrome c family protein|nr:cytochrome c [Deltaproteobacteria bacterium]MBW2496691.1 cytochrome c [Deltaproteobacteria bacterium]
MNLHNPGRIRSVLQRGALAFAAIFALASCGADEGTPAGDAARPSAPAAKKAAAPAAASPEATQEEATALFQGRCVTCHGAGGRGDGPASKGLDPKPRNFQDPEWQTTVTDEHLRNVILYGGGAVGLSPAMPGNPDLIAKRAQVDALIQYIRDL